MDLSARGVARSLDRIGAAARNALEVARFGGLDKDEETSPHEVVHEHPVYRLRHYFPDVVAADPDRPPVVLVPPLMLQADVYDVSAETSAVRVLSEHGIDPWVVDFGAPEREEGGLERTLTDHVLAVSDAVDEVRKRSERDVHLAGYSQGGMFCYQAASYRQGDGVASVVTFGSPIDTTKMIPGGLPEDVVIRAASFLADNLLARGAVPAWVTRNGFRMIDPAKTVRQRVDFVRQLHDRDSLLPRENQRRFLATEGWVAYPGPALAELMKQFVSANRMLSGGFVIEDHVVTLADITCPLLCFVGTVDEIASPRAVRAIRKAAPLADIYQKPLPVGHFGLVVGSRATTETWPTVAAWAKWRDGRGEMPDDVTELDEAALEERDGTDAASGLVAGIGLATDLGVTLTRSLADMASLYRRTLRGLAEQAREQMPRLARLNSVRPRTRVSPALLLDEQAAKAPDDTLFLFEDRGYSYGDAKRRTDNVVRGLISLGIRQGEHIGVLMETRPSALTVVAALNRVGVVAVMLRPDGPLEREVELGQVGRVVTDPEHAAAAVELRSVQVLVLGGGGEPRDLGDGVVDMERIDPDTVELPAWYSPNPGRARDLAFILFTGEGNRTRVNRVTNGRWALSAFGTATAAALGPADTVYGITPLYHPAGLLTAIGGAVAGGARVAMTNDFDPAIFWDEVRRYGVTVVSYTWTSLRGLVNAPRDPREQHHPIRMFIGSGMPTGLWRRVLNRFAPAKVLEFYASTEGDVVLVNLKGIKVGARGRPLPGSAKVRVVAFDPAADRLVEGRDGFAQLCGVNEVGMLLAEVDHDSIGSTTVSPLRGVLAKDDAWLATGDLFRRDADGDFWWIDHVNELVATNEGVVPTVPVAEALMTIPGVDLAVAYGVDREVVAAVAMLDGASLDAEAITEAVALLEPRHRPHVVRVVDDIPISTWYRPLKGPLRDEGIPEATPDRPVFRADADRITYQADSWPSRD